MDYVDKTDIYVMGMSVSDEKFNFEYSIENALILAESEIQSIEETIKSINNIRPNCDNLDYTLAASSGVLCGIIDIFLVGKPGESPIGVVTDKWFANRTIDFAKLCGFNGGDENSLPSVVRFLEKKFKIPYDQRGAGDAASEIFDLNPSNHHFKSLGHNPSLLGLFFSILDQFTNQSHFISGGELIALQNADEIFKLHGSNVSSKLYCGFVNWIGHLISDISGSSGSKGRGMGIPSPLWTWTNDIIAIKNNHKISVTQFDKAVTDLALNIYKDGYDIRFQTANAIPVFVNEIIVRLIYSIRRLVKYFITTEREVRSYDAMCKACNPFSNYTVKRMITVAHGTFCMIDIGDAVFRAYLTGGGSFNTTELFLRLNIVGVGRFTISLFGEGHRMAVMQKIESESQFASRELVIAENYLSGLKLLSEVYDDKELVNFIDDFKKSNMYIQAFKKTSQLAELRKVTDNKILWKKSDIDIFFGGGKK